MSFILSQNKLNTIKYLFVDLVRDNHCVGTRSQGLAYFKE